MTDEEWKKRYNDLDKKYRDMKEEFDVLAARNKNGRYVSIPIFYSVQVKCNTSSFTTKTNTCAA